METPAARVRRLILALEDLFQQQNFLLDAGQPAEALLVQDRCRPLVEDIACTMLQPGVSRSLDADTQQRAQKLITDQIAQHAKIELQKTAIREELSSIAAAQARTSRFKNVYLPAPTKIAPGLQGTG